MLKASVNGKCFGDKSGASATITTNAGEVNLKATIYELTSFNTPSLRNLSLSLEKPGSFNLDYDVPTQDLRFQFMNSVRVLEKPLNLTYTHSLKEKNLWMDGTLVIDTSNKVSAIYKFDSGFSKLKYTYSQNGGLRTFDTCYHVADMSWDFAISQRVLEDDVVRGSYQSKTRVLGLDWCRASPFGGCFKVSASLNLAEEQKIPKFSAESTWDFDM